MPPLQGIDHSRKCEACGASLTKIVSGGIVLDPFAGTGSTGEAAWREGMRAILIEREPEYQADIARRMDLATQPTKRAAVAKTKNQIDLDFGPLFAEVSP